MINGGLSQKRDLSLSPKGRIRRKSMGQTTATVFLISLPRRDDISLSPYLIRAMAF